MERMPFRDEPGVALLAPRAGRAQARPGGPAAPAAGLGHDWRTGLPVLTGAHVVLRELRASDAASLFALLTAEDVARFISPPPASVEGFARFIAWTLRQRAVGSYVCFAVTRRACDTAIGIFQVRQLEPGFGTAEWGFALGSAFWGTGVFQDGATLVLDFAFGPLGVHRLEARAAVPNGRGHGALLKMGAVPEGRLRQSFLRHGQWLDQVLYGLLAADWTGAPPGPAPRRPGLVH
jgi:ribosomal-protein-alanine N-acetyltransferase